MKKVLLIILLTLFSLFINTSNVRANAAEPPMVWILVPGTFEHVDGILIVDTMVIPGTVSENKIETYIRFYYSSFPQFDYEKEIDGSDAIFIITLDHQQYSIKADIRGHGYNDLFTLNVNTLTLEEGTRFERNASLISIRLFSTLVLEALVFFLMGYRKRRTWILFLIVNLVTQGFLNLLINAGRPESMYMLFALIVYEAVIIFVEEVVLLVGVKEGKKLKLFFTILLANVLSLFLGGWFILNLPL